MSFGSQAGPPASVKQMAYLKSLLQQAGFDGFRDARHPLGLSQRQAGGKFSGREASDLIDKLLAMERGEELEPPEVNAGEPFEREDARRSLLRGIPADLLVDELTRRGWTCAPP